MKLLHKNSWGLTALAAFAVALISCSDLLGPKGSNQTPEFVLVSGSSDFGTLGGPSTYASSVNDDGVVVGYSTVTTDSRQRAFKWSTATGIQALLPSYPESNAEAISASGVIVGSLSQTAGGTRRAFRMGVNGLEIFGKGQTVATASAVNSLGVMVGREGNIAAQWGINGTKQSLGTLGGSSSWATGINDAGVVVGFSTNNSGVIRAFKWTAAGGMQQLPMLPEETNSSYAYAINNAGQIVGDFGTHKATLWEADGTPRIIITERSSARGLNERGEVVGVLFTGVNRAFVWDGNDGMTVMAEPNVGMIANAINVHGLIVGGSKYWQIVPLEVTLDCTPATIVRGDDVSCTATWMPSTLAASEIMFEWRFESDSVRVFPAAAAFAPLAPVGDSVQGMSSWEGQAVIGGRVSVRAIWRSQSDTAASEFVVASRSSALFGDLPVTFTPDTVDLQTDSTQTLEDQPPVQPGAGTGAAGYNYDVVTGDGNWTHNINGNATLAGVQTGPNRGYWYVVTPGMTSNRGVKLRTWLTGRESPKFSYQNQLLTNRGLLETRRSETIPDNPMHPDSTKFLIGAWAHETYGHAGANGHQGQKEMAAKSLSTCGKVPAILERVVANSEWPAIELSIAVKDEGIRSLAAASGHDYVYGNVTNVQFYEVVSGTTSVTPGYQANTWVAGDVQQPTDTVFSPHPNYKCNRIY